MYELQLGFHAVAGVSKIVHKWKINNYIRVEEQYAKQLKNTEHTKQKAKRTKQEKKHEKNNWHIK
jgi:hypothetical protein